MSISSDLLLLDVLNLYYSSTF